MSDRVILFHSPQTRSTGIYALLEELGADYDLHLVNMRAGEQRQPAFLAINPMGKVPAILHGDALVTEQGAICVYLGDHFAAGGLAPAIGDPLRGPYLRWMFFYGSCFEPAVIDRSMQRPPARLATSPYGDFDMMLNALVKQLHHGPWMLGERFTALDVLWATALSWTVAFKLVPELPEISAYTLRVMERPAIAKAMAKDVEMAAKHAQDASST